MRKLFQAGAKKVTALARAGASPFIRAGTAFGRTKVGKRVANTWPGNSVRDAIERNAGVTREWCRWNGAHLLVPLPSKTFPWREEILLTRLRNVRRLIEAREGLSRTKMARQNAKIADAMLEVRMMAWPKPLTKKMRDSLVEYYGKVTLQGTGDVDKRAQIEVMHGHIAGWCRQNGIRLPEVQKLKKAAEGNVEKRRQLKMEFLRVFQHIGEYQAACEEIGPGWPADIEQAAKTLTEYTRALHLEAAALAKMAA